MLIVALLALLTLVAVFAAWRIGRLRGYVSASFLYLASFVVYYPVSGFAHLLFEGNLYRGFFDLYRYVGGYSRGEMQIGTVLVAAVALASCIVGLLLNRSAHVLGEVPQSASSSLPSKNLLLYGFVLMVIGATASITLFGQIDYLTIDRNRRLDGGVARYAFMSAWFSLGVSIVFAVLAKWLRNRLLVLVLFLVTALLIGANLYWTGGRSVMLLFLAPVLLHVAKFRRSEFRLYVLIAAALLASYVAYMTELRVGAYRDEPVRISELLDWQLGRYSMLGYGIDYVERKGFLFGQTYGYAALVTLLAPLQLVGAGVGLSDIYSITGVVGQDLFGRRIVYFIVPGIFAEGYMNFGLFGVAAVGALGGVIAGRIDAAAASTGPNSLIQRLLLSYLTAVLCINYLNSTFQASLSYVFYFGAPFVLPVIFSKFGRLLERGRA